MTEKQVDAIDSSAVLNLTTQIVSAYVRKATLRPADLIDIIGAVAQAVTQSRASKTEPEERKLIPAVPIRRSVRPDFIVCLEDGKKLKMLKRHLRNVYGMTPADYRAKWRLPPNYPMTAPAYAAARSAVAKANGLGTARASTPKVSAEAVSAPTAKKPGRGGRPARRRT